MANVAEFDSTNFNAAASPAILDVQAALGTNTLRMVLICDGPGTINVANSNDGGLSFGPDFRLRAHEHIGALLTGLNQIRLTHTGVDSAYRVLGQAGAAEITFTRPNSSATHLPLRSHFEANAGQVQVASGTGTLIFVCNKLQQPLKLWDFDGVGPTESDLIADFMLAPTGVSTFGASFVNGLRIETNGKGLAVHYE